MSLRKWLTRELPGVPSFVSFTREDRKPMQGRRGKVRLLHDPNPSMRELHLRMIKLIRSYAPKMPWATGSMRGLSPQRNAARHINGRYFYLTDISGAFENTDSAMMAKILAEILPPHYSADLSLEELTSILKEFFFDTTGGLIQGAPASPDLFNLYCHTRLDIPMANLLTPLGMTFSRYTDDITISSTEMTLSKPIRQAIRKVIESAGFRINDLKTQYLDIQKMAVVITGVGMRYDPATQKNALFTPYVYVGGMEATLHDVTKKSSSRHSKLEGKIAAIVATMSASVDLGCPVSRRGGGRTLERYQQEITKLK